MGIGGQASGDYRLSAGALRVVYSVIKDTIPVLAADGFTQSNPPVVTSAANKSTTIPVNVKKGVLGGSVAFTRPDIGANTVGGPVLVGGSYVAGVRPLGLFLNDAQGNAWENVPAAASGKAPFLRGGAVGVKLYETQQQTGGNSGLTWAVGDRVYASVNGYLTNRWQDSYEFQWINGNSGSGTANACLEPDVTCLGIVIAPPDANTAELFVELYL